MSQSSFRAVSANIRRRTWRSETFEQGGPRESHSARAIEEGSDRWAGSSCVGKGGVAEVEAGEGDGGCVTAGRGEVTSSPYTARVIRVNVEVLSVITRVECCVVWSVSDQEHGVVNRSGHTAPRSRG